MTTGYSQRYTASVSTFGERLRTLREARGYSVADLAALAGLHRVAIHRLESGGRLPAWDTATLLADALDVTLDDFRPVQTATKKTSRRNV